MDGEPILSLQHFGWRYAQEEHWALRDVNLEVRPGEMIGVVGRNGAGKSTLMAAMRGLIPAVVRGQAEGEVLLDGRPLPSYAPQELLGRVGLVFSDPESQFTAMSVEEELAFGLENQGEPPEGIRRRVMAAAGLTGIGALLEKSPFDLSGGQKQRTAIAAVLALEPAVLLLDEPASMLDPAGKEMVYGTVARLSQDRGRAVVIADHDLERLLRYVDRLVLLDEGQVVLQCPVEDFWLHLPAFRTRGLFIPLAVEAAALLRERGWYEGPMPREARTVAAILETVVAGGGL